MKERRAFLVGLASAVVGAVLPRSSGVAASSSAIGSSVIGWGDEMPSLCKGDVITISGVYTVNPFTKVDTGRLCQFVVTADVAAGENSCEVPICPSIIPAGPYQNVTSEPKAGAPITLWAYEDWRTDEEKWH